MPDVFNKHRSLLRLLGPGGLAASSDVRSDCPAHGPKLVKLRKQCHDEFNCTDTASRKAWQRQLSVLWRHSFVSPVDDLPSP